MAKVLNPFGCSLNRNHHTNQYKEIEQVEGRPVYRNGYFTIWKQGKKHYDTCWKNIIITQTVGAPRELVDALVAADAPKEGERGHYHYHRMIQAIEDGRRYASQLNFNITTI